jgi:peptidyl-prolyl cis-trans isomerase SurA
VDDVAFSLPEGTLSDPIRVEAGYAVLRVLEKKPFDPVAYDAQKASIAASLREQKKQQFFQAYMLQVRERFPVERNPEAFQRVTG